jgi:uracil-DNA glycosylase family 4
MLEVGQMGAVIAACKPWLLAELAVIQPDVLVCPGSAAAQAILGRTFKVTQMRGTILEHQLAPKVDGHRASVVDPARAG